MSPTGSRSTVSHRTGVSRCPRLGFSKVDLLAVIAMLGLILLLALPSLNLLRINSRRTTCLNNLRVTALAVISYQSDTVEGYLPAMAQVPAEFVGTPNECDVTVPSWSWQVYILPYMEADDVFELLQPHSNTAAEMVDQAVGSDGESLLKVLQQPLFACPGDQGPLLNETRWLGPDQAQPADDAGGLKVARGNYVGVNTVGAATSFVNVDPLKYPNIPTPNAGVFEAINQPVNWSAITDGRSNTFMIGERSWKYKAGGQVYESAAANQLVNRNTIVPGVGNVPCGYFGVGNSDTCASSNFGKGINFPHADPLQSRCTYSSLHPGGANFAYCDGSTQFVTETIDPITMMNLTEKSDVDAPVAK